MRFQLPARPTAQTKTQRREWRKDIRRALGTSGEQPPSPVSVLRAAAQLNNLLQLTTSSRYTIVVQHIDGHTETPSTALRREIALRECWYANHGKYPSND
jgi:hypothetical protein